ncbi:MAG TPA: EutN/CcmL family microcompartment protein [Polyangia bacterium]|nr:EutN/CcmL family microcompartment protein [Polyangia bacterium]
MILGRVVGFVWATRKHERLVRGKLLVIEPYGWYEPPQQLGHLVAVDTLDAGVGDDVVVCLGAPGRWQLGSVNLPIEAAVLAVVDHCEIARAQLEHTRPFEWLGGAQPRRVEWLR